MTILTEGKHAASFILSEASGMRSRDTITIVSGAGVVLAGTVLGKITASGKYTPSTVAAADGSQTAAAVNIYEVDATSADVEVAGITRDAEVNKNELTFAADADTAPEQAAKLVSLATVGIIAR